MKHEQPESKQAKRQYWLAHIESWRKSGLGQAEYSRHHLSQQRNLTCSASCSDMFFL